MREKEGGLGGRGVVYVCMYEGDGNEVEAEVSDEGRREAREEDGERESQRERESESESESQRKEVGLVGW